MQNNPYSFFFNTVLPEIINLSSPKFEEGYEERTYRINGDEYTVINDHGDWSWMSKDADGSGIGFVDTLQAALDHASEKAANSSYCRYSDLAEQSRKEEGAGI